MIPLVHQCRAEGLNRFVTRLRYDNSIAYPGDSLLLAVDEQKMLFSGDHGLIEIAGTGHDSFDGDVVVVDPSKGLVERLIRANSVHNTLLVTEQCDQLCVMCSQPPKKHHLDRFEEYRSAAALAPFGATLGVSGGEPTLYKAELFDLIEATFEKRPDLSWHVLSNAQHFEVDDVDRLSSPEFKNVTWGVPIYSTDPLSHDAIVGKQGAYTLLEAGLSILMQSAAKVELRTVLMQTNSNDLPLIADFVARYLRFVVQWSIMQLENIGFAKNRFPNLYFDHATDFSQVARSIDIATLFGIDIALFNFTLCSVPESYREYCAASISDWKRKFPSACGGCSKREFCSGFFEWHPESHLDVRPL